MTTATMDFRTSVQVIADRIREQRRQMEAKWAAAHPRPVPKARTEQDVLDEIARIASEFDPGYEWSDDYNVYALNRARDEVLRALRRELASMQRSAAC